MIIATDNAELVLENLDQTVIVGPGAIGPYR